jgi:hypothetical protein
MSETERVEKMLTICKYYASVNLLCAKLFKPMQKTITTIKLLLRGKFNIQYIYNKY